MPHSFSSVLLFCCMAACSSHDYGKGRPIIGGKSGVVHQSSMANNGRNASAARYLTPRQAELCRVQRQARDVLPEARPNWDVDPQAGWFQAWWEPW